MTGFTALFEQLGLHLVTWTWQAALVVLLAWGIVKLDRRNRPALRSRLWSIALVSILLLPWTPSLVASFSLTQQLKQSWHALRNRPPQPASSAAIAQEFSTVALQASTNSDSNAATVSRSARLLQFAGVVWVLGLAVACARRLNAHLEMRGIVRRAGRGLPEVLTDAPPVLLSFEVAGPMLYGCINPVILLPADILQWSTPEERLLMIQHERLHYRHNDNWRSAGAAIARTALFFHPLVHLACRELRDAREYLCDDRVLELGFEPQSYAETIIKVAVNAVARPHCGSIAFAASAVALDARVERLFQPSVAVARPVLVTLPACLLLIPAAALGFLQSPAAPAKPEPEPVVLAPQPIVSAPAVQPAAVPMRAMLPLPKPAPSGVQQANPVASEPEPFVVNVDQLKSSESSTLVLVTVHVSNSRLGFVENAGVLRASGQILTKVTAITGETVIALADSILIERPVSLPPTPESSLVFQARHELPPGLYKLDVALKDDRTGNTLMTSRRLGVRRFGTVLAASTLILGRNVEVLPPGAAPTSFQIGNFKLRPVVREEFRRDEALSFVLQIYGLSTAPATIETSIVRDGTEVRRLAENVQGASEMTMTKTLPLSDFETGDYSIQVTIIDTQTAETIRTTGQFRVR
jgi:beta-lactamase regulating signal transducer with metallopeptidase domain